MFRYLWGIVFLGVFLLLFFVVFKGEWVLKSFRPNFISALIYLYNPPDQIFEPLVKVKLDVDKEGVAKTSLSYSNAYYGSYVVMLRFEKNGLISYSEYSSLNVTSMIICISSSGKELTMSGERASWGYTLSHYTAPDDLPLEEIHCSIELSNVPGDFFNDYGPAYILVKKISDI